VCIGVTWETLQIAAVLALIAALVFGTVKRLAGADILALAAMATLLSLSILGTNQVLKVFGNPAPFTVACLFILATALERTGVIDSLGQILSRARWRSPGHTLLVVMLAAVVMSAFINATPIVVILTPILIQLAHMFGQPPSKMLIPLSYAAILGGACTLIGATTNIIVDGVAQQHGLAPFGIFEITLPGLALAATGIAYIFLIGRRLMPDRQTLSDALIDVAQRKFLTEVLVPQDSPLIGKTLTDAGLTRQRGFHVVDVLRADSSLDPEHGEPVLAAGDRLVLRTGVAEFLSLRSGGALFGAAAPHAIETISSHNVRMMEGIVGPHSSLVGQPVADLNLRRLYDTYILAIHRQNEKLHSNFDQVRLQFGDTLLLEGPTDGLRRLFEAKELVNLTQVTVQPFRRDKAWIAGAAVALMIITAALNLLSIPAAGLIAVTIVVACGCLDTEEAYRAVNWPILMVIFGMLALGAAMQATGLTALIAGFAYHAVGGLGPFAVLSLVYLATSLLTELMGNNATAILITPIVIGLAEQMGIDARPLVMAVMFAASASFATPIGYPTNTFVYGAGGYQFLDFTRAGVPLNLLLWLVASLVIPLFWPFTPAAS
jgi:di/tricarboxylate transporter